MGNVNELSDTAFEEKVLKSSKPVLVDFWAVWCQPCKAIAPIVEEVAGEYGDKAAFFKVDTDNNKQFAGKYGVRGIPTLMVFKDGKVVDQVVGMTSKSKITGMIDKALG